MDKSKKENLKVLFLDILADNPKVKKEITDLVYKGMGYSEATRKMFGLGKKQWSYIDATAGNLPKVVGDFDAVVIGGSTADPIDGKETKWMKDTYAFIKKIITKKIPILGICGGLQFTARALGQKVIMNPKGRELDVLPLKLTKGGLNDPLFKGLSKEILVCSSHKCMVREISEDWKLLASSKMCDFHAIAVGDRIRLTQFHPEMKISELKALAKWRKDALIKEGFFKDEKDYNMAIKTMSRDGRAGKKIIKNFIKYFILPNMKSAVDKKDL